MATQQIEFEAPSGLTLTCALHQAGSDTVSYTASAVTEQTNRKGIYRATFSGVAANFYQLIARSGLTGVASWWGYAQDLATTFTFGTNTSKIDANAAQTISLQIAVDIESEGNNWDIATAAIGSQSALSVWNSLTSSHTANGSFGQRVLRSTTSQSTVAVTGSNHVAADIHEIQTGAIVDSDFAAGSIYAKLGTLIEADPVSGFRYTTQALEQAPSGGGGGGALSVSEAAQLAAIYSKIHGVPVVLSSTATNLFSGNPITIYRGSEHSSSTPLGPMNFNVSSSYNVTGWTGVLKIFPAFGSVADSVVSVSGSWADVGLSTQRIHFTLDETDTDNLDLETTYKYQVELLCGAGHPYASPAGSVIIGSIHS